VGSRARVRVLIAKTLLRLFCAMELEIQDVKCHPSRTRTPARYLSFPDSPGQELSFPRKRPIGYESRQSECAAGPRNRAFRAAHPACAGRRMR
jgi:hypothetical protein